MNKLLFLLVLPLFLTCACSEKEISEKGTGYLTLNISQSASLKAGVEISDFFLRINDGYTDLINDRIGGLPSQIALPVGTYTIEAYSMEFSEPKFEMPFYSGKTTVEIEAGENSEASLVCSQGNAGIKVVWSGDFSTMFSTYQALIDCDQGYLHYSSDEMRTGYFLPGTVFISILADGKTINGGAVHLAARDMVTATLRTKESPSGILTIDITIDETVNEREIEVIVDPGNTETEPNSETNPYTIAEAIAHQGENAKWITGYIVGSNPTTTSTYDFKNAETWQATNIVLADDINETDSYNCIFVSLPSTGAARNNLNLVAHPENLGHRLTIRGNLGNYLSRNGLTNVSTTSNPSLVYFLE